jgi:transcriptional regulator NrdR family protein
MNKKLAISYGISEFSDNFASEEEILLDPVVVLFKENEQGKIAYQKIAPPVPVRMQKRPLLSDDIFWDKNDFYKKIKEKYRANQERIISDLICGIILRELRGSDDTTRLTFFITAKFNTNKIVGRLAYLNLPMDKVTILFVSRNVTDFYTRNIVSPFDHKVDLTYLNEQNTDSIFGPYPYDGTIGLIRTFYKTYEGKKFYPVRTDLFCQSLSKMEIDKIKKAIKDDYLLLDNTETEKVIGLKKNNYTRLPKILQKCENHVKRIYPELS